MRPPYAPRSATYPASKARSSIAAAVVTAHPGPLGGFRTSAEGQHQILSTLLRVGMRQRAGRRSWSALGIGHRSRSSTLVPSAVETLPSSQPRPRRRHLVVGQRDSVARLAAPCPGANGRVGQREHSGSSRRRQIGTLLPLRRGSNIPADVLCASTAASSTTAVKPCTQRRWRTISESRSRRGAGRGNASPVVGSSSTC